MLGKYPSCQLGHDARCTISVGLRHKRDNGLTKLWSCEDTAKRGLSGYRQCQVTGNRVA